MENAKKNNIFFTMEFSDVVFWLMKWKWIVITVTISFAILGYFFSNIIYEPKYTAKASMVVNSKETKLVGGQITVTNNDTLTRQLMTTYEEVLTSNKIFRYVVNNLGINDSAMTIKNAVTITTAEDTLVVYIEAEHVDPYMAKSIANATMEVAPLIMLETVEKGSVNILDFATLPTTPSSPKTVQYIINAALLGILISSFFVILLNFLTMKIKNSEDIEFKTGIQVFGEIPHASLKNETEKTFLFTGEANSGFIESYFMTGAVLKNNSVEKRPYKLMVTSSVAGEGKTTTSINIATVLADMGHKVLLIDLDMKKPNVARQLKMETKGIKGIESVIRGGKLEDEVINSNIGFDIIPCTRSVRNTSKLLSSVRLELFFAELDSADYDYIVIDTAPAHIIADTSVIVKYADGLLLVVKQQFAKLKVIMDTVANLRKSGANIIGAILNDVRVYNVGTGYAYKYKYGYYYYYKNSEKKKRYSYSGGYYGYLDDAAKIKKEEAEKKAESAEKEENTSEKKMFKMPKFNNSDKK